MAGMATKRAMIMVMPIFLMRVFCDYGDASGGDYEGGDGDDVVEKSIGEIQLGAIHHTEAPHEPHTRLFNVVGIDVDATQTRSVSGS